jgi:putative aminopeptidase FrvX
MKDRLRALTHDLMLIPGLSGHEGRVRRYLAARLDELGLAWRTDRLGNLIDLGFPVRYTHSSLELCDLRDLEALTMLLANGLCRIDRHFSRPRDRCIQ